MIALALATLLAASPETPPPTRAALCAELGEGASRADAQREVLASIQKEREALAKDRAELEQTRAALKKETERLEALVARAQAAKAAPAKDERPAAPAPKPVVGANVEQLARTVRGMKPEQAAVVIARLDTELSVQLLRRMKPADAGAVMSQLKPELAANLVASMATAPALNGGVR